MIVVFECYENMNKYEEEMEFEDDTTDEEIDAAWGDWVWEQTNENYGWRKK